MSGTWRRVALASAALAVAVVFYLSRQHKQAIDGLNLPSGTVITWAGSAHTHITAAVLPQPAPLFGLMIDRLQRSVDGGWAAHLAGPQSVDGWTCQPDLVELTQEGRLRRCPLAAERDWNGWRMPATSLVTLNVDGSLGSVYFDSSGPLAVCGTTIWNTVTWRYDAATSGQGRDRKPSGVSGVSPEGDLVELSLPGCAK